jgi:hypothetical protein
VEEHDWIRDRESGLRLFIVEKGKGALERTFQNREQIARSESLSVAKTIDGERLQKFVYFDGP